MRDEIYIPEEVKKDIRAHLNGAIAKAVEGFSSASEEEDTLTGELFGALRSGSRSVFVPQSVIERPGNWKWSITYNKFRGRGPGAPEKFLGADGILTLNVQIDGRHDQKSSLFQAKIDRAGGLHLFEQALLLSTWREAAFVLVFSGKGYDALTLDDVIGAHGNIRNVDGKSLANYLGADFLNCKVGDKELLYDGRRKKLLWRDVNGKIVSVRFQTKSRFSINIESPGFDRFYHSVDEEVIPNEIRDHRMKANDLEILSLDVNPGNKEIKKAHRRLALIYHPDTARDLNDIGRRILDRRMQEINAAAERVKASAAEKQPLRKR